MQSEDGTGIERAALPDGVVLARSSLAREGPKQPCYDGSWMGNAGPTLLQGARCRSPVDFGYPLQTICSRSRLGAG